MVVNFFSPITKDQKFGGGVLRINALLKIYEKLGLKVNLYTADQFQTKNTWRSLYQGFRFGPRVLFKDVLSREIEPADFHHFESIKNFSWSFLKNYSQVPIVYSAQNLEFELYFGRNLSAKGARFQKYELDQMEKAKVLFFCSEREREVVTHLRPTLQDRALVVPNLLNASDFRFEKSKNVVSFIGSLDYAPNIEAVQYLCREFMVRLPVSYKQNFRFVIAGKNPSDGLVRQINESGFELIANIDQKDLIDLYAKTEVCLVPLSHGSGTRLKIAEAIFSKSLVLSTPLGAEGVHSSMIIHAELDQFVEKFKHLVDRSPDIDRDQCLQEVAKGSDIDTWFRLNEDLLKQKLHL